MVSQIWMGLDSQLIRSSFSLCGIIDDGRPLNSALRQLIETNDLPNSYVDDSVDDSESFLRDESDQISGKINELKRSF